MVHAFWSRSPGRTAIVSGLGAAAIYLLMIMVTLAHIEAISGLAPFDMRPGGYTPTQATAFLNALGAPGRGYYLNRQIPLDMIYPGLLALTLSATLLWLGKTMPDSRLIRFGIVLALGCAGFDYAENLAIAAMILGWPEPSVSLIHAASTATIIKSVLTTLAVLTVVAAGLMRTRQAWSQARA